MGQPHTPHDTGRRVVFDLITMVSAFFLAVGAIFLLGAGILNYNTTTVSPVNLYALFSSVFINLGTGFITAGVIAFIFERFSKAAMLAAQNEVVKTAVAEIEEKLSGENGLFTSIKDEITHVTGTNNILINEIFRSTFSDELKKNVLNGGIISAFPMWCGNIPDDFFTSQERVDIFLKDGHSFFENKISLLIRRFLSTTHKTRILLLHPDYEHIGVVADMDNRKRDRPLLQKGDCISAIKKMHTIREQTLSADFDCANSVLFLGYHMVPTWNGFISENAAYIHLYTTLPYRGDLNTLFIVEKNNIGKRSEWYQSYRQEYDEIVRSAEENIGNNNLWTYNIDHMA